jgi:hypothetical protein
MQNGKFCDSEGNLRPWEFELAFRDLLRRYAQRRLADCASGAAGTQEAEVAKIGALKMIMLNMEQVAGNELHPPASSTCEQGAGRSIDHMLLEECESRNSVLCSNSSRHRPQEQSAASTTLTNAEARPRRGSYDGFPVLEASSGCAGTDLAAIAQTVRQVLWEQRATSSTIEEISAVLLASSKTSITATMKCTKSRTAFDDARLPCRTRLTPATHSKRFRMLCIQKQRVEWAQTNSLPAKRSDQRHVSAEVILADQQSFTSCNNISYEFNSDTNSKFPDGKMIFYDILYSCFLKCCLLRPCLV